MAFIQHLGQAACAPAFARLKCFCVMTLLHQQIDEKLVGFFARGKVRSAVLLAACLRPNRLDQAERLFNVFSRLAQISSLLLRSGSALQSVSDIVQIAEPAKYRKSLVELVQPFVQPAEGSVHMAQVAQRDCFPANISGSM